jgi:hypothetical protein
VCVCAWFESRGAPTLHPEWPPPGSHPHHRPQGHPPRHHRTVDKKGTNNTHGVRRTAGSMYTHKLRNGAHGQQAPCQPRSPTLRCVQRARISCPLLPASGVLTYSTWGNTRAMLFTAGQGGSTSIPSCRYIPSGVATTTSGGSSTRRLSYSTFLGGRLSSPLHTVHSTQYTVHSTQYTVHSNTLQRVSTSPPTTGGDPPRRSAGPWCCPWTPPPGTQ